jgi:hypothetical protein
MDKQTPPLDAGDRLVAAATTLTWLLEHPAAVSPAWRTKGFGTTVEWIRRQLLPIPSCQALATSYEREAFVHGATEAAYALRWLELEGRLHPSATPWTSLWSARSAV